MPRHETLHAAANGSGARAHSLAAYLKTPAGSPSETETVIDGDVVLTSRVRLARNLAGHPFPHQASGVDLRRVAHKIKRAAREGGPPVSDLAVVGLAQLSPRDRWDLVNARRISPDLARGPVANRFALLDENGTLGLFINEEDHLRLQAVVAGNAPLAALRRAEAAQAGLARRIAFAHDTVRWGYLTASLGNVGTGMRLSLLLHLPALSFLGRVNDALRAAHVLGISVRAAHGEHSAPAGDLFQVSNAVSWGLTSEHIAGRVAPVADYLVAAERAARREVEDTHRQKVLTNAQLAWKTIQSADRIASPEALRLLSALRLCAASNLASGPTDATFPGLLFDLRTAEGGGAEAAQESRDAIARAAKLRNALRPFWSGE